MASSYRIVEGSLQEKFFHLRNKIQVYAGGFANGKTSAACIRALELMRDYPGSNGLIARSTYPKLNDTIRKEFLKWCPKDWIKSFPMSANGSNTCTLRNGSTANFRYIQQQSAMSEGQGTSNLLSATYDWIIVDQVEDPEIVHKDFLDLLGRLRGMAQYVGEDFTMPRTGPRWMILTANPTRNWFYKEIIRPYQVYKASGTITPGLLCERDDNEKPILGDDDKPQIILDLVEGSTYENAANLEGDFIRTLESTYRGNMRDRFLKGQWAAYEGLIYPNYDSVTHMLSYDDAMDYLYALQSEHYEVSWIEGYDFGIAVPSCYIIAFVDPWGNIIAVDGFHVKGEEMPIEDQRDEIKRLREEYGVPGTNSIMADPSIFRRTSASRSTIGKSTADIMYDNGKGVKVVRGNNDIMNGIIKVTSYLVPQRLHAHPITGETGAPHFYHTDNLTWISDEFGTYMWNTNSRGERDDKPRDKDDHAMDAIKYMLSRRPEVAKLPKYVRPKPPAYMSWQEREVAGVSPVAHRHG